MLDPANAFLDHTIAYLQVCAVSVILATLLGITIGVAVVRSPLLSFIAVNLSGLMRAIPIIAFLAAALPYLGVGFKPTVVALTLLGIPPILLNTYTGIRSIEPAIIDAARGMGLNMRQILLRIQVPLVLPIVAAGVRTSAVQIVATATLAAIIGAGGYGEYIINGLYEFKTVQILAGALPVAVLAMLVELLMGWLQRALTPAGLRVQEMALSEAPRA
ncbi:MAG: ABC transporter permease [Thermogemmatispora sp.]|nr:ABC transporter permease [Thermogemmatispora sp.]